MLTTLVIIVIHCIRYSYWTTVVTCHVISMISNDRTIKATAFIEHAMIDHYGCFHLYAFPSAHIRASLHFLSHVHILLISILRLHIIFIYLLCLVLHPQQTLSSQ
jgi:hypothetical protein